MSRRCDRVKTIFMGRPKESGDVTGSPWFWENTGSTPFSNNTGSPSFWDHTRSPNYSNNIGFLRSLDISRSPLFQNFAKLCLVFCLLVNRDVSARRQDCASCAGVPCQKITGSFTRRDLDMGYHVIAVVPASACNFSMTERMQSRNFLAVRSGDNYIINGHWEVLPSGKYRGAGSAFIYSHTRLYDFDYIGDVSVVGSQEDPANAEAFTGFEQVESSGPFSQEIDLMVIHQEGSNHIVFQYWQPVLSQQNILEFSSEVNVMNLYNGAFDDDVQSYNLTNGNENFPPLHTTESNIIEDPYSFSDVNNPKTSSVDMSYQPDYYDHMSDSDFERNNLQFIDSYQYENPQNDIPISSDYHFEEYSTRNPYGSVVSHSPTYQYSYGRDTTYQSGDLDESTEIDFQSTNLPSFDSAMWKLWQYSPCSKTCGGGTQQSVYICTSGSGEVVAEGLCAPSPHPAPHSMECNTDSCPPQWDLSEWSSCSVSCGEGHKTRTRMCVRQEQGEVTRALQPSACPADDMNQEALREPCSGGPCSRWRALPWSACSARCGTGSMTRSVDCVVEDRSSTTVVDPQQCNAEEKPPQSHVCHGPMCPASTWFFTDWNKQCVGGCRAGRQHRRVWCYSPPPKISAHSSMANFGRSSLNSGHSRLSSVHSSMTGFNAMSSGHSRMTGLNTINAGRSSMTEFNAMNRRSQVNSYAVVGERVGSVRTARSHDIINNRTLKTISVGFPFLNSPDNNDRLSTVRNVRSNNIINSIALKAITPRRNSILNSRNISHNGYRMARGKTKRRLVTPIYNRIIPGYGVNNIPGYRMARSIKNRTSKFISKRDMMKTIGSEKDCSHSPKPAEARPCLLNEPCASLWFISEWSKCTFSCGGGHKAREVVCVEFLRGTFKETSDSDCQHTARPPEREECGTGVCPPHWYRTSWSQCSAGCGNGTIDRLVACLDGHQQPSSLCPLDGRPEPSQPCHGNRCNASPDDTSNSRTQHLSDDDRTRANSHRANTIQNNGGYSSVTDILDQNSRTQPLSDDDPTSLHSNRANTMQNNRGYSSIEDNVDDTFNSRNHDTVGQRVIDNVNTASYGINPSENDVPQPSHNLGNQVNNLFGSRMHQNRRWNSDINGNQDDSLNFRGQHLGDARHELPSKAPQGYGTNNTPQQESVNNRGSRTQELRAPDIIQSTYEYHDVVKDKVQQPVANSQEQHMNRNSIETTTTKPIQPSQIYSFVTTDNPVANVLMTERSYGYRVQQATTHNPRTTERSYRYRTEPTNSKSRTTERSYRYRTEANRYKFRTTERSYRYRTEATTHKPTTTERSISATPTSSHSSRGNGNSISRKTERSRNIVPNPDTGKPNCRDSYSNCKLVVQARLCPLTYYATACCRSCNR